MGENWPQKAQEAQKFRAGKGRDGSSRSDLSSEAWVKDDPWASVPSVVKSSEFGVLSCFWPRIARITLRQGFG